MLKANPNSHSAPSPSWISGIHRGHYEVDVWQGVDRWQSGTDSTFPGMDPTLSFDLSAFPAPQTSGQESTRILQILPWNISTNKSANLYQAVNDFLNKVHKWVKTVFEVVSYTQSYNIYWYTNLSKLFFKIWHSLHYKI